MPSLNFVVTLLTLVNLFVINNCLDHVKRTEQDKMCPCIETEHCPRIYGKSAMDIREMGLLPPCQDFGKVRCCGVSIRIEQDDESKNEDWSNIDIKTENFDRFRDTNSILSQPEDDLDSAASDLQSTQRRPSLQKIRRRKPNQAGHKDSTSQNYPDVLPKQDDSLPAANSAVLDPVRKTYSTPTYPAKSPQSKVSGNKNILKLRRPAFRPTETQSISTSESGSSNKEGSLQGQTDGAPEVTPTVTTTGVRSRLNSLVGGRKKIHSSSFGASVLKAPPGGTITNGPTEVVKTLEIKETFPATPSSPVINLTTQPNAKYIHKMRPFTPKTTPTADKTDEIDTAAEIVTEELSLNMDSLAQHRPESRPRTRLRRPDQTNHFNEESQMVGTPIILTTGKPEFHINKATNQHSQSQHRIRISTTTLPPTTTSAPLVFNAFETEEKVGQLSPDSSHSTSLEPEPLLTNKRVKYIRRRVRPKTTMEPTQQQPNPLVYTSTTTSSQDLVIQPDLMTTTTTMSTEPEPEHILFEIPPKPVASKVSYSVSSQVSDSINRNVVNSISIPVTGKIAIGQLSSPPTPSMERDAIRIYSSPSRGQSSYYKTYDTQNYNKDEVKPMIVTPTPFQPFAHARTRGRRPAAQSQNEDEEVQPSESIKKSGESGGDSDRHRFRVPAQLIRSRDKTVTQTKSLNVAEGTHEAEQGEGSENYDLVLDKNARESQSYKVLNPRQRNNRFSSTIPNQPVVYSLSSDLANHKDHYEYDNEEGAAEESRTQNIRRRPNKQWMAQPGEDDESVSSELVARRPRPKAKKPAILSQSNSHEETTQQIIVPVPVPVAVPVQIGSKRAPKPTRIPQRVTTSETNRKPAGYRRIKNKPAQLQQPAVTESTTVGDNPRKTSLKATEIMSSQMISGSNDQLETSTEGWVFPPYRIHIAPSPTTTLSPVQVEKEATNLIATFSGHHFDSMGPLDVLATPLAPTRRPPPYPHNEDAQTEYNYSHQIQPTESTYVSYDSTTPMTTPQREPQPQTHESNFKQNSTRFGIPQTFDYSGSSAASRGSEIPPGHPGYVRFPTDDDSSVSEKILRPNSYHNVKAQTEPPYSHHQYQAQTEASQTRHHYQTKTEEPYSNQEVDTKIQEQQSSLNLPRTQTVINIGNNGVPIRTIQKSVNNDNQEVPNSHHPYHSQTQAPYSHQNYQTQDQASNSHPVQGKPREPASSTNLPRTPTTVINIGNTGVPVGTNQKSVSNDNQEVQYSHHPYESQTQAPHSHQNYQTKDQAAPRTPTVINIGSTGVLVGTNQESVSNDNQEMPYSHHSYKSQTQAPHSHQNYQTQDQAAYSHQFQGNSPEPASSSNHPRAPTVINIGNTGVLVGTNQESVTSDNQDYSKSVVIKAAGPLIDSNKGYSELPAQFEQNGQYEHNPKYSQAQYEQSGQYIDTSKTRPEQIQLRPDTLKASVPITATTSSGMNGKRPYHQSFDSLEQSNPPTPTLTNVINITGGSNNLELYRPRPPPPPVNQAPIHLNTKEIPQVQAPSPPFGFQIPHFKHQGHSVQPNRFPISTLMQPMNKNPNQYHEQGSIPRQPWNDVTPDIRHQSPYPGNTNSPPATHQSPPLRFEIREPGNNFQEVKPITTQPSPHYITEYHHHHSITQQILSRLRNTVRTSRATNLTLEDLDWLTGLVEAQEKSGSYNITDEILTDDPETDEELEFDLQDGEKVVLKGENISETTNITSTPTTTTLTTQKLENLLGNESLVENNEKKVENLRENKPTVTVTERQENPNIKGGFRAPKMIQRGFFPLLPYSEEDPGPLLVNARSLGTEPTNGSGRNRRTSRDFKLFDARNVMSLTTDSNGVPSPTIPIRNGTGMIRMI